MTSQYHISIGSRCSCFCFFAAFCTRYKILFLSWENKATATYKVGIVAVQRRKPPLRPFVSFFFIFISPQISAEWLSKVYCWRRQDFAYFWWLACFEGRFFFSENILIFRAYFSFSRSASIWFCSACISRYLILSRRLRRNKLVSCFAKRERRTALPKKAHRGARADTLRTKNEMKFTQGKWEGANVKHSNSDAVRSFYPSTRTHVSKRKKRNR